MGGEGVIVRPGERIGLMTGGGLVIGEKRR